MSLQPGTTLGPYSVTAKIGEGGMGEVWQARDTKLDRDVALKVLPEAFTQDPDRLARFEREAKVLASLNHPNIGSIYGLEEAEGVKALVLELVEGPTLADRIKQGPIPLDEALPIAKQIAEALEAAHEAGVIHRDLKPANIKVREDGTVKVLDFGLAKALEPSPDADPSQSPTLTAAATQMGVIMGTAAYMSPEQASGETTDKRSDIWSFGVVLFEMLTGQRLFTGKTVSHVLGAVLQLEPRWDALPVPTPQPLRKLLRWCLEKDRKSRLRDIGDALTDLDEALTAQPTDERASAAVTQPAGWRQALPLALGISAVAIIITGLAVWSLTRPGPTPERLSTPIPLTPPANVGMISGFGFAVSPDGRTVVFVGSGGQLYRRSLSQLDTVPIPGTARAWLPFFSPDGTWVGYIDQGDNALKKIRLDGSQPVTLCPVPTTGRSAGWGPDGTIVFTYVGSTNLWRVSANGGDPEPIAAGVEADEASAETHLRWIDLLPDGKAVLASVDHQIVVVSLDTGERKILLAGITPRYTSTGHIIYWRENGLWAVPFDAEELALTGPSTPVLDGVAAGGNDLAHFALGGTSLVYEPGTAPEGAPTLVWVDREGNEEVVDAEPRPYTAVALSPDGGQAALQVDDPGNTDLVIYDVARDTPTRFTFDPASDQYPAWTPDGERVVFSSTRDGGVNLYWKAADGTGQVERLTTSTNIQVPVDVSPDGMTLLFVELRGETGADVGAFSLDGDQPVDWLLESDADETYTEISPDGRWVAYVSNESGQNEVYVRPFPNVDDGRWQVSRDFGSALRWGPNSRELFFQRSDGPGTPVALMVAAIDTEPTFAPGIPRPLFEGPYRIGVGARPTPFDVSPDGQRFLMIKDLASREQSTAIILVENWFEELKRLVPVP